MNKLSVVISAYNEERNIEDCLKSAKELADELIVIDNCSTDKTPEIAKRYAKVFEQENNPNKIDVQKNFGFSKATGDWILSLDADERLTPELSREIKSVISNQSSVIGYWIPRKNIIFGKWIKSEMWWPDYQLKLFRKGKGKYEEGVHKALQVDGETEKLETPIVHHNYVSIHQYLQKLNTYTDIEAKTLVKEGYKFNWLDSIRFPLNDFLKTFFLQKGYRDGIHGLVLSMFQGFYMGIVFAKLWEKEGFKDVESEDFVKEVKKEFKNSAAKIRYWIVSTLIDETKNPVTKAILKASRRITSYKIKSS